MVEHWEKQGSSNRLKNTGRMALASRIHKAVLCGLIIGQIFLVYKGF